MRAQVIAAAVLVSCLAGDASAQAGAESATDNRPIVTYTKMPGDDANFGHAALVDSPAYVGQWIVTGKGDIEAIVHDAVNRCKKATGADCSKSIQAASAVNLAVGSAADGTYLWGLGGSAEEAMATLKALCTKHQNRECTQVRQFDLKQSGVYAPENLQPRKYAAIAVSKPRIEKGNAVADSRFWVAFGQLSAADAFNKAMEQCKAALGTDACQYFQATGPFHVAFYSSLNTQKGGFKTGYSNEDAIAAVNSECKADGITCDVAAVHAVQEKAVGLYDLSTEGRRQGFRPNVEHVKLSGPDNNFGHAAIVDNPAYLGRWIVTGKGALEAIVHEAVILCRKATGADCRDSISAFSAEHLTMGQGADGGYGQGIGRSAQEALANLKSQCMRQYKRPCGQVRQFDLTKAGIYEPETLELRKYGAIVADRTGIENGNPNADPRFWIALGQASWKDAISKAMEPCIAALGKDACRFFSTSGETQIAFYRDSNRKTGGFMINLGAQEAIGDVYAECTATGMTCEIIGTQATKDEIVGVYDLTQVDGVPLKKDNGKIQ